MLRIFCLFLVLWSSAHCQQWMTQYDQHFQFFCPPGQTIKALDSIHDNHHEDRVWNFTCIVPPHGATLSKCEWSGYINDFDQPVDYNCPNDGIICGIESVHDNHHEDRKWSYYCCFPEGFVTHACEDTPYENTYDHVLNYRVPDDFVLRGVQSVHDNRHEDRIFKFDICRLDAVGETVLELRTKNSGIESVNDNGHEDRKRSFLCCDPEGYVTHACLYTPYDNALNYRVPNDFVLRGVDSVHDNHYEDRIFKFDICKLDPIGEIEEGAVVG